MLYGRENYEAALRCAAEPKGNGYRTSWRDAGAVWQAGRLADTRQAKTFRAQYVVLIGSRNTGGRHTERQEGVGAQHVL